MCSTSNRRRCSKSFYRWYIYRFRLCITAIHYKYNQWFNGTQRHDVVPKQTRISLPSEGITNAYVESIGLFNTVLKEKNGDTIIISNSTLTQGALRNFA